jgi:hypothetical protein
MLRPSKRIKDGVFLRRLFGYAKYSCLCGCFFGDESAEADGVFSLARSIATYKYFHKDRDLCPLNKQLPDL